MGAPIALVDCNNFYASQPGRAWRATPWCKSQDEKNGEAI